MAGGRIRPPKDVGGECVDAGGGVADTGCVVIERVDTVGRVLAPGIVTKERVDTDGSIGTTEDVREKSVVAVLPTTGSQLPFRAKSA
jgi:hypothetical protein